MTTTNYPKSYILDRITARRASLESKRAEANAEIASHNSVILAGQITMVESIQKAYHAAEQFFATLLLDPNDLSNNARAISEHKPGSINYEDPFRSAWSAENKTRERLAAEAVTAANGKIKMLTHEIDALDHTEAYLRDTPIEEFSLTSLKRLGLMEAIKFNLDEAMKTGK